MMSVRVFFSTGCRLTVIANRGATSARASSTVRAEVSADVENWTRRKNWRESGEENCCDSVMLPPSPASTPVTAWTMPVESGQVTLKIHSQLMVPILIGGCAQRPLRVAIRMAVAAPEPGDVAVSMVPGDGRTLRAASLPSSDATGEYS